MQNGFGKDQITGVTMDDKFTLTRGSSVNKEGLVGDCFVLILEGFAV